MRIAFTRWRFGGLLNRPSPRKRLLPRKKTSSGFEFVSDLTAGASAMPAKWSRRVFSFRFYEGKISEPVTLTSIRLARQSPMRLLCWAVMIRATAKAYLILFAILETSPAHHFLDRNSSRTVCYHFATQLGSTA